ncbi:uncharacterized protein LOC115620693 [Scaptodrosophila lebanonensis]|uniref:Uncharacterized protein LOC115620693 n=1 Tax=Drosophila lebanonensis TaxID=7225 RepID=A0A6J2T3W1_DROLE|nr:uncharacterized protein LOC115620693 [Scaptodrosophila lebanonensis]
MKLQVLSICVCVVALAAAAAASANYATAASTSLRQRARRPKNATETQSEEELKLYSSSSRTKSNRLLSGSGGSDDVVAQYKLPSPAPANDAVQEHRSGYGNEGKAKRRRTQIVMRRRPAAKANSTTTTTTTTSTTMTSTTTTTPRPSLANGFNLFGSNFWNFGQQSIVAVSSTRSPPTKHPHPPKKFTPSTAPSSKQEKLSYLKQIKNTRSKFATSTSTVRPSTDGPFRIALPTLTLSDTGSGNEKEKDKRATSNLRVRFNCPREHEVRFQLFPKICETDKDCGVWQRDELCCDIFGASSCVTGVPKPLEETPHEPIFGLIQRKCPARPLAELWWDVQECETDQDCWPRVCCPDGRRRYCRTSQPELEMAPVPVRRSFNYLTEYLECTAPPPPIFDLHPKACTSTLDCFPNVCCQEAGLRHCRPPKKSVLTLMANFLNVDFVKRLTQNIVIK